MMYSTGCRDCDRLTSGRCWRHATTVIPAGTVHIIEPFIVEPTIVPAPEPIWTPIPRD